MSTVTMSIYPVVFVLQYQHRHGEDLSAHATLAGAEEARASLCVEYADEIHESNPTAGEEIAERIRMLHAEGKYTDCVNLYLSHVQDEFMDIHELEIRPGLVKEGTGS